MTTARRNFNQTPAPISKRDLAPPTSWWASAGRSGFTARCRQEAGRMRHERGYSMVTVNMSGNYNIDPRASRQQLEWWKRDV